MTSVFDNESYLQDFSEEDPKTWKDVDPKATTMAEVYKVKHHLLSSSRHFFSMDVIQKFGLDENTSDFVGHALALFR